MSAPAEAPKPKHRKDYKPTPYLIDSVSLDFVLNEDVTQVTAVQKVRPNHTGAPLSLYQPLLQPFTAVMRCARICLLSTTFPIAGGCPEMCLNGREDVELVSLAINGSPLPESAYTREPKMLTIAAPPPGEFELTCVTHIKPQENTSLEGLYKSGGNFSSQVLNPTNSPALLRR
jgi:aminopeptidase N